MPQQATNWPDMIQTVAEGVAVVGTNGAYEYVSTSYGTMAGLPVDVMVGESASELQSAVHFPAGVNLADPAGATRRFECRRMDTSGSTRWHRVTLISLSGGRLAVLALDVTAVREAEADRRAALRRLTIASHEARRVLCQRLHDGPVQLLSALGIRLETAGAVEAHHRELLSLVEEARGQFRALLSELDQDEADTRPGVQLSSWMGPLVDGSGVGVEFHDLVTRPISREVTEALFVTLHDIFDAVRVIGLPRLLRVEIADTADGLEMVVRVPSPTVGYEAVKELRADSARSFVESLDGRLSVTRERSEQVVTVWLPDEFPADGSTSTGSSAKRAPIQAARTVPDLSNLRSLTDEDWKAIGESAFEGLVEVDGSLRIVFANQAFAASINREPEDLVGLDLRAAIRPENRPLLDPHIARLMSGQTVRFEWGRRRRHGALAWMQVAARPHLGRGDFDGALIITQDTTELHLADLTRRKALDDYDLVRAQTEQRLISRLQGESTLQLEEVLEGLRRIIADRPNDPALATIANALEQSIPEIERTAVLLNRPAFDGGERSSELEAVVSPLLIASGAELEIIDDVSPGLTGEWETAMFQIAREAIANAVFHGRARRITVALRSAHSGIEIEIRDDGVGAAAPELRPSAGHLGIRSMRAHASSLGGDLRITQGADCGVEVVAWVPLAPAASIGSARPFYDLAG